MAGLDAMVGVASGSVQGALWQCLNAHAALTHALHAGLGLLLECKPLLREWLEYGVSSDHELRAASFHALARVVEAGPLLVATAAGGGAKAAAAGAGGGAGAGAGSSASSSMAAAEAQAKALWSALGTYTGGTSMDAVSSALKLVRTSCHFAWWHMLTLQPAV